MASVSLKIKMASREAFDSLMTEYQHKVYRLAYSLLGNQALAEEAAQEPFLRVWKSLDDFRGESSPSTWIYSIARNTCLTLRKTHARPFIPPRPDEPPHPQGAGAPLDWDRAIAELPEKHRQVVLLYFMQEKSYEE